MAMIKMHCKKGKSCIKSVLIVLLWLLAFVATIYVINPHFIDAYIVPRWLAFGILYSLLFVICSICQLRQCNIDDIKEYLYMCIVVISTIESVRGVYGYILYRYPINGCFDNVAGYASMQCISIPFILYFCREKFHIAIRYSAWFVTLLAVCSLVLSQSRAGVLVSLAIIVIFLIISASHRMRISLICSCGILFIAGVIFCLSVKGDSTEGRKFILNRSWEMIEDKPLFGFGIGGFKLHYMDYQAGYFASNEDSRHSILADNINHPLNEYVKIIIEYGIMGLLCVISGVILLYRYIEKKYHTIDLSLLLALLSIALFAMFSYPLQYPHTWLILSLPVFLAYIKGKTICKGRTVYHCFMLVLGVLIISVLSIRVHKELEWGDLYRNHQETERNELLYRYEKLYTYFKSNPYFLYNYAHILYQSQEYDHALWIANKCNEYWHDYNLEILRGDIYDSIGYKDYAIYTFINASHMCPNRFMPLHKLFRMALKQQDFELARFYAKAILSKSIKVDSAEVRFIINECYNYYHHNKL